MGLARQLSMGPRRPVRRAGRVPAAFAAVRRLARQAEPDVTELRAALDAVAGSAQMRFVEGAIYQEGCNRYREITGEDYGPRQGVY